ncbi:MAG: hypothetical protein ACRBFS_07200 [Aureispira sp.]
MSTVKQSTASAVKRYSIIRALLVGIIAGLIALGIGYAIDTEIINNTWEFLFAPAAVGIALTVLNFKPLSKFAIFVLPPVYALSGFGMVAGPLLMAYLGFNKSEFSPMLSMLVETVPFFIIASMLYRWYSSLANQKSFILYLLYGVTTVVVSMLLFDDKYPTWLLYGAYLGFCAFLFSLLHLNRPLTKPK